MSDVGSPLRSHPRQPVLRAVAFAALAVTSLFTACGVGGPPAQSNFAEAPGTIELNQAPPNDTLVGGGGTGTVFFHGTIYRFTIGGVGVDGSSVAILQTSGEIYRLADIAQFPGTYHRAPSGSVDPGRLNDGLWLQNEHATIMHLRVPPRGRMPDIGNDAVRVVLDQ